MIFDFFTSVLIREEPYMWGLGTRLATKQKTIQLIRKENHTHEETKRKVL